MMKFNIFILIAFLTSCGQVNEDTNNEWIEKKDSVVKNNTHIDSTNNLINIVNNIESKAIEDTVSKICTISGQINFSNSFPVVLGGIKGPSFFELVKRATSKNCSYNIELYMKNKLIKTITTNHKNNFHYQFDLLKNSTYNIKFYYKDSLNSDFTEITDGNFQPKQIKIRDENEKKCNVLKIIHGT
mgnify:FL=1